MAPSALSKISEIAANDALPIALDAVHKARAQIDGWVRTLLGKDFDERVRQVS